MTERESDISRHLPAAMTSSRSGPALTFRLAHLSDAEDVTRLINSAFRSEPAGQTWLFDDQAKRKDIISLPDIQTFVQDPEKVTMLVGSVTGETCPVTSCYIRRPAADPSREAHRTPDAAWLGFLVVDPSQHKRGLGAKMLFQAEAYVRDVWNIDQIELDVVSSRTQLREWYRRCGYLETGRSRPFFYGESGREILADGLEMVVMKKELPRDAVGYQKCEVQE